MAYDPTIISIATYNYMGTYSNINSWYDIIPFLLTKLTYFIIGGARAKMLNNIRDFLVNVKSLYVQKSALSVVHLLSRFFALK